METFIPRGICARQITFEVDENGLLHNVRFYGGCSGNHNGIQRLIEGQSIDFVIERLEGTLCAGRNTSCPDQLAKALIEYKKKRS